MNLYELDRAIAAALESALEFGVDMETGEVIAGSFDELEALSEARDKKLENIGLYIKNLSYEVESINTEAAALKARADVKKRKIERLKEYVTNSLLNASQTKFEAPRVAFSLRRSEAVNVLSTDALPPEFTKVKTEVSPDKVALKKAIKAGQEVPGAELIINQSLQIK